MSTPGTHFAEHPDYVDTWPAHCVVGTEGFAQPPGEVDVSAVDAWFTKGEHSAAYSGFEGAYGHRRRARRARRLAPRSGGSRPWTSSGIATDHCVRATALDAVSEGFSTRVILDLTAGVAPATTTAALDQLREAGARTGGPPGRRRRLSPAGSCSTHRVGSEVTPSLAYPPRASDHKGRALHG